MSTPDTKSRLPLWLLDVAVVLGLAGLTLWLRWPSLGTEGFHNEDAAGIAYNADLIRRGLRPLVDNLEYKAPGSFFLSYLGWAMFGRSLSTLVGLACFWSMLAAIGVYVGGRLLYNRRREAIVAGVLYAVLSPVTDSIDINYGAWLITPYIWSTVFFIAGQRSGKRRWTFAAGVTLALAGLMKRQAAVIFPVFAGLLIIQHLLARPEQWPQIDTSTRRRLQHGGALVGGLAAGFGSLMLVYAVWGGLGDFVGHYFFSSAGWQYVGGSTDFSGKISRLGDGFLGLWEYLALPSALALTTLVGARSGSTEGTPWTFRGVLLTAHFWMSFVGIALGFRFFKSYYLQLLPAAVWIAAHPEGALVRWMRPELWRGSRGFKLGQGALALVMLVALIPAGMGDIEELGKIRKWRTRPRDGEAQRVARVIKKETKADDTIWVWGRWAWPVYYHADRMSPTRYYKVLGVVTNGLTNTWRRSTQKTKFVAVGPHQEIVDELAAARPAFIVTSNNEDYSGWKAFRALLKDEYVQQRKLRLRSFKLWKRKDL
ncbi:MAG: ArnT family glycosyltransferase [Bradymonadia bacterium]